MISICVPFWRRKPQFLRVLDSIQRQAIRLNERVEVSIYEDIYDPKDALNITSLHGIYPGIQFINFVGDRHKKVPMTPCEAQNTAVDRSHGDTVIIQAADIYHPENTLKEVQEWLKAAPEDWCAVAPCIHLDQEATEEYFETGLLDYSKVIECQEVSKSYSNPVPRIRWTVHPEYYPVPIPTFFATRRETLNKTGIYSLEYAQGSSWADQDLMMHFHGKVHWLKNPVIHLWHEENWTSPEMVKLGLKNQRIFERKWNLPVSELANFWKQGIAKS